MSETQNPIFPNIIPSSIKMTKHREAEKGDFSTEEDLQTLILLLFHEPECEFFYFVEQGSPSDPLLSAAIARGDILVEESEFFYYRHPKIDHGYVHIDVRDGNYAWDWQRDVVEKGPMFIREKLKISARKRTELEIWQKIEMEDAFREHRKKTAYQFDVFLSYATGDRQEALRLHEAITSAGGKAFLAEKCIQPGEDFAEKIRQALLGSRELWLLISHTSKESEWVISEWGAAWALEKKIVPILHRCPPESLPDRLRKLHAIDYYRYRELIENTFPEGAVRESKQSLDKSTTKTK